MTESRKLELFSLGNISPLSFSQIIYIIYNVYINMRMYRYIYIYNLTKAQRRCFKKIITASQNSIQEHKEKTLQL